MGRGGEGFEHHTRCDTDLRWICRFSPQSSLYLSLRFTGEKSIVLRFLGFFCPLALDFLLSSHLFECLDGDLSLLLRLRELDVGQLQVPPRLSQAPFF